MSIRVMKDIRAASTEVEANNILENYVEQQLAAEVEAREKAEEALKPKPLPEGLVPHAYELAATIQNADYWYKAGHEEKEIGKAVLCMAQAMFAWKNAALAKAEDAMALKQRAESAEQRIREAQDQKPRGYLYNDEYHEVRPPASWPEIPHIKLYTAPIPPADVQEVMDELIEVSDMLEGLQRENSDLRAEVTRLNGECERLGRKLAEQQAFTDSLQDLAIWMTGRGYDFTQHTFFTANRKRLLAGKPDASELKNVVDSELTKLLEQAKQQAVPEWKPIETAPKDGTWMMIGYYPSYLDGEQQGSHPFIAYWSESQSCWRTDHVPLRASGPFAPTHWMPLPIAPQPSPESAEERKD